jgi:hypothetical protein
MLGSLGDLARELGKDNEVPDEFLFADALTVAGAIMSGRFTLDLGLESDTRLYTVTVGESADTKKTTAQRKVSKFFDALKLPDWSTCHGVGSAEGLSKALNNCSRIVLAIDELKQLLQKTQIRGSVLLPMITSLYERTDYENYTKEAAILLNDARLSIMANSTLDTYESLWDHESLAIGLVNRLYLVTNSPRPKVARPKPPNSLALQNLSSRIHMQLSCPPPSPYRFTQEADDLWATWYVEMPKGEFSKRLDGLGFRLMPILAATMDKVEIDAQIISMVTAILNYELHTRKALQPIDADNAIANMEQKIIRVLDVHGPLNRRDLGRYCNAHRTGEWIFRTGLDNMIGCNLVILDTARSVYRLAEQIIDTPKSASKQVVQ